MVKIIEGYILNQVIGEGNFGLVYRATHKQKSGVFAVKVIPIQKFQQNDKLEIYTNNEIQALKTIGISDSIIRFYTMIKSKSNCYLIYQYCNGGTLLSMLRKQGKLQQKKVLLIFKQLLEAFKVLNKYSIMHRDLKPQNIFFTTLNGDDNDNNSNQKKKVKLGDFGFCKGLKPDQNLAKTMLGSPIYMAPQVLKGQSYTTKADIWSLGVILFQMLYGYCPFQSRSIASLINTIDTQPVQLPNNVVVSQRTQNLIKRMLAKDYFRRIGWIQLFGIKIDENGEYIEQIPVSTNNEERGSTPNKNKFGLLFGPVPLDSISLVANSRSFSAIRDEDNDKIRHSFKQQNKINNKKNIQESLQLAVSNQNTRVSSQPKDQKRFYSQNYMNILSTTPMSLKKIQEGEISKSKEKIKELRRTSAQLEPNTMNEKQIAPIPSVNTSITATKSINPILQSITFKEQRLTSMDNLDIAKQPVQQPFNTITPTPTSGTPHPNPTITSISPTNTSTNTSNTNTNNSITTSNNNNTTINNNNNSTNNSITITNNNNNNNTNTNTSINNNNSNNSSNSNSSNNSIITNNNSSVMLTFTTTNPMPVQQTPFNKYRQNIGMGSNLSKFLMDRSTKQGPRKSDSFGGTVSTPLSQISQKDNKRNKLLKLHQSITKTICKAMMVLQQKFNVYKVSKQHGDLNVVKDILQDCYIVLKIIQQKLKTITQSIKITETSLLDMASIINYQHIQVQKFIIEMRNELMRCSMQLPNIPIMIQVGKIQKNQYLNNFKEFIKNKYMAQLIDDNF